MEDEKDFDDIPEYRNAAAEEKFNIRAELEDIKNSEVGIMDFDRFHETVESNVRVLDSESQTRLSEAAKKESQIINMKATELMEGLRKTGDPWVGICDTRREIIEGIIRAGAAKSLMVDMMRQEVLKLLGLLVRQRKSFVETEKIKAEKSMFETSIESMGMQMRHEREMLVGIIIKNLERMDNRLAAIESSVDSGKPIPENTLAAMQLPEIERTKAELKELKALREQVAKEEGVEAEEDADNKR